MTMCYPVCHKRHPQFLADHLKTPVPWEKENKKPTTMVNDKSQLFFESDVVNF